MRANGRLVGFIVLLALPFCATVLLGLRFVVCEIPRLVQNERRSVVLQYREKLDDLKDDPSIWRDCSASSSNLFVRAQPRAKEIWGYRNRPSEEGGGTLLWRQVGGRRMGARVETIPEFDYRLWLTAGAVVVTLSLAALTLWAIFFFVRYAKERDDFVAATAHDLTTPLVALRRMIGRDDGEAKVLAERMVRLVENLTVFLRLGGERPAPNLVPLDLRKAYDEAYSLFREDYRWQFGGRDIAVEGVDEPLALADPTRTVQIVWNLLANDLKYAAPFGPVGVRFGRDGDTVSISFVDCGKGLSPRDRKCIFRRYYRAKSVMRSGKGGFGIGLCTAREFARSMGGDLTVAGNVPTGCVFTLTLRRAK